jgi:hypothetical protein
MNEHTRKIVPAIVPREPSAPAVIERTGTASSLPAAVSDIVAGVQGALAAMNPDDIDISLEASQHGDQSNAKFRFRAYRRREAE